MGVWTITRNALGKEARRRSKKSIRRHPLRFSAVTICSISEAKGRRSCSGCSRPGTAGPVVCIDSRTEEFNPLKGTGGTFGFARTEVVQHLPILRETWVVSLRARTESVVRKSDVVPYFLMPYLGSGDTLRGYPTGRFRDRHTLLLGSELRWFPNRRWLDLALFFDAGKVAPQRSLLTLDDMKTDYGIGVRFHTPATTALRLDVAKGREGWRLVVATSPSF